MADRRFEIRSIFGICCSKTFLKLPWEQEKCAQPFCDTIAEITLCEIEINFIPSGHNFGEPSVVEKKEE